MPTPSDSIGREHAPSNVPQEPPDSIQASHCPPGELLPPSRPSHHSAHGLLRNLPTPPQDTPTTAPRSMPRARGLPQTNESGLQDGVGHTPHEQPNASQAQRSDLGPGSTENPIQLPPFPARQDADGMWRRIEPSDHSQDEEANTLRSLDTLRLLEAARRADNEQASWESDLHDYNAGIRPHGSIDPSAESLFSARVSHNTVQDTGSHGVRWPITRDVRPSYYNTDLSRDIRNRPTSPSGPSSVDEQMLRQAYQTLQQPSALQHLRNSANNYARLASGGDWIANNQRSTMSFVADSANNEYRHGSIPIPPANYETADRSSISRPAHIPRPRRDESSMISPDRSDLITELPPLTPPTSAEGRDYGFGSLESGIRGSRASPSSPLASSESEQGGSTSSPRYHTLKSQKFGRYQPSCLQAGSVFTGKQCSDSQEYQVKVEIKHVDMDESFLCGHLTIDGLTRDHDKLETYFEGEIIGSKYTFTTRHPTWGASEKQDMLHWNRFAAWKPLARAARQPDFCYRNFAEREHIFMRWKEYFLVPDHRVRTINGASFEGFYYICFNQRRGTFSGIYYHAKSERWQQLELQHVTDRSRGCTPAVELA